ncbi:MAG TPA: hypothetical protein VFK05_37845 [Polyangiaceae bacterium]|nr:hypothetical protein [Polyangiaceae bacterium]
MPLGALSFTNATIMTQAVRFVCVHPLVGILALVSLTLTALTATAHRVSWPRWKLIATLASLSGWATIVLCLVLGFELMTITRIAATRPDTSREDVARLNSLATDEFLCVAGARLLLGVPGTLVGPFLRRRRI